MARCAFFGGRRRDKGGGVRFTSLEKWDGEFSQGSRESGESWKALRRSALKRHSAVNPPPAAGGDLQYVPQLTETERVGVTE